jgi:hypothetical protein
VAVAETADAIDLDLYPNEASDLAVVPGGLVAGYDQAFVTVLDEGVIEDSVALLGHGGDDPFGGWEAQRLRLSATVHAGRTEDAEACDFHRDHLYVFGSHFGSKDGPLQAGRAWVARVAKADLPAMVAGKRPQVEIARNRFSLHRAINDRLREAGPALRELGPRARERLILRTIKRAEKKQKAWAGRVREDDQPINIEGMCFLADGTLLLGLRYPVTAEGEPILVELVDIEAFFADPDVAPTLGAVWTLECAGSPDDPVGIRALHRTADDRVHAIVGSLDALGKDSALVADHPAAGRAHCEHWAMRLPKHRGGGVVECRKLHSFPGERSVEGLAKMPSGPFLYVIDRDHNVHLRFLLAEDE